jgi:hypothetical protein
MSRAKPVLLGMNEFPSRNQNTEDPKTEGGENGLFQNSCVEAGAEGLWDRLVILSYLVSNGVFELENNVAENNSLVNGWFWRHLGMQREGSAEMSMHVECLIRAGRIPHLPSTARRVYSNVGVEQRSMVEICGAQGIRVGGARMVWGMTCPDTEERGETLKRPINTECCALFGVMPVLLYWVVMHLKDAEHLGIEGEFFMCNDEFFKQNVTWQLLDNLSYNAMIGQVVGSAKTGTFFSVDEKHLITKILDMSLQMNNDLRKHRDVILQEELDLFEGMLDEMMRSTIGGI